MTETAQQDGTVREVAQQDGTVMETAQRCENKTILRLFWHETTDAGLDNVDDAKAMLAMQSQGTEVTEMAGNDKP